MPFPQREGQVTWPRHQCTVTEAAHIALECSFVANAAWQPMYLHVLMLSCG